MREVYIPQHCFAFFFILVFFFSSANTTTEFFVIFSSVKPAIIDCKTMMYIKLPCNV